MVLNKLFGDVCIYVHKCALAHSVVCCLGCAFRISITFRKMDESKRPVGFTPEPYLEGIKPLPYESTTKLSTPPAVAAISSSRWGNDQNGTKYNSGGGGHREGRKHHESRRGYHHSESRDWSSSSNRRRGSSRHSPSTAYRPKVHSNNTSSDNV